MFDLIRRTENDLFTLPNLVSRLMEGAVHPQACGLVPPVDVIETTSEFRLMAECPGLSKDTIGVSLENHTITISGEKNAVWEPKEDQYYRAERRFGRFSRSFTLPVGVEASKIRATYKDGVLEVVLPKTPESQPRKIEVKAA